MLREYLQTIQALGTMEDFFVAFFLFIFPLKQNDSLLQPEKCVLGSRNDTITASVERSLSFQIQQQFLLQPQYISYREEKLYVS